MTAFTDEQCEALAWAGQVARERGHVVLDRGDGADIEAALTEIDRLRAWQKQARELLQLHGADEHCHHLGTPAVAVTVLMDPAAGFYGLCPACAADWPDALWLVDRP